VVSGQCDPIEANSEPNGETGCHELREKLRSRRKRGEIIPHATKENNNASHEKSSPERRCSYDETVRQETGE